MDHQVENRETGDQISKGEKGIVNDNCSINATNWVISPDSDGDIPQLKLLLIRVVNHLKNLYPFIELIIYK